MQTKPYACSKDLLVVMDDALCGTFVSRHRTMMPALIFPLAAHQQAFERCRIMHCDVSTGNIIVYPRIVYDAEKQETSLSLSGMLVDWELARIAPVGELRVSIREDIRLVSSPSSSAHPTIS